MSMANSINWKKLKVIAFESDDWGGLGCLDMETHRRATQTPAVVRMLDRIGDLRVYKALEGIDLGVWFPESHNTRAEGHFDPNKLGQATTRQSSIRTASTTPAWTRKERPRASTSSNSFSPESRPNIRKQCTGAVGR